MAEYNAVIILSSIPDNGGLGKYAISRLEKGLELYPSKAEFIGLSGHLSGKMRDYLIRERGIEPEKIFDETYSLDTVSNALCTKLFLSNPKKWNRLAVVSSDFHIERVREIFQFIYSNSAQIDYYGSSVENDNSDFGERERNSLEAFRKTFDRIKPGDDIAIIERLFESHLLFRSLQERDKANLKNRLMRQL